MTTKYMDVHTDDGIYKLILDDQAIDEEGVYELIKDLNVPGTIWHGWTPYDDHNDDAAIIVFGVDANIKSVRIYEVTATRTENDIQEPVYVTDKAVPGTLYVHFLGGQHTVNMWLYRFSDDRFNVLPYEVDNTPAIMALNPANLVSIITSYYEEAGICSDMFTVVIPEQALTAEASARYLTEYSRGKINKAKAWKGWHDTDDSED